MSQSAPSSTNVLVIRELYWPKSVISAKTEEEEKIKNVEARTMNINLFLAR